MRFVPPLAFGWHDLLMDQDGPERRRAELTAEDVHDVAFSQAAGGKRGYDEGQVNAFLERVEQQLRNPLSVGGLTAAEVEGWTFSKPAFGKSGYDPAEVDTFVERVARQLAPGLLAQERLPAAAGGFEGPTEACAKQRGDRNSAWVWLFIAIFGSVSLVALGIGVHHSYGYLSGTPTTATVSDCHGGPKDLNKTCHATWSVGGETRSGTIEGNIGGFRAGSVLDVHVRGGSAYTATSGFLYLGEAMLSGFIPLVALVGLWRIRTGAVTAPGRHARRP